MSQGANKPVSESARHRGRTSQGTKEPGGEPAKGRKSQTPCFYAGRTEHTAVCARPTQVLSSSKACNIVKFALNPEEKDGRVCSWKLEAVYICGKCYKQISMHWVQSF